MAEFQTRIWNTVAPTLQLLNILQLGMELTANNE